MNWSKKRHEFVPRVPPRDVRSDREKVTGGGKRNEHVPDICIDPVSYAGQAAFPTDLHYVI